MTDEADLKPGSFYWVIIVNDPDAEHEWESEPMPARYGGKNSDGEIMWTYLNQAGDTTWPVKWIGPELIPPM